VVWPRFRFRNAADVASDVMAQFLFMLCVSGRDGNANA